MLVRGFPAGPWGTNCFVVAPGPSSECIVIDPGKDALEGIDQVLAEFDLHPVAALLTHGHIDHTWSMLPLCAHHNVPAVIHAADRLMLTDPLSGLSPDGGPAMAQLAGGALPAGEPKELRFVDDGDVIEVAGLPLNVLHSPGHTRGSVTFLSHDVVDDVPVLFSGDLIFAGAVGRTDLPGGSWPELLDSLARVVLPLADDTVILPGHGAATTVGVERTANPYLQQAATAPPHRGL